MASSGPGFCNICEFRGAWGDAGSRQLMLRYVCSVQAHKGAFFLAFSKMLFFVVIVVVVIVVVVVVDVVVVIVAVAVECCCFLLLIIIDEGSGDAEVRFDSLKPSLSEAIFKLLLQNDYVPGALFCCWDCFRTTLTHLRAFYKLDVEGDNR